MRNLILAVLGTVLACAANLPVAIAADVDVDAVCSSADVFDRLECEAQVADLQKRRDVSRAERAEVLRGTGSAPATRGFPSLIMLHGPEDALVARFSNGGLRFEAREGDPVTAEWTLYKIHQSRVDLRNRKGEMMSLWLGAQADPSMAARAQ